MLRGDPSEAPQSLNTHTAQSQTWNLPKATKLIFTNHFKDNYKICEMIRAPKSLKTNIGNKPQRKLETLQQVPNQFSCNIYRKHYEINTTLRFNFSMAPKSLTKINVIQCKHWKLGNPKLWSVSRPSKTFRKLWSWVSRNIYKTNKLNQTDSHIESHAESHLRTSHRDVRLCKIENSNPVLRRFSKTLEELQKVPKSVVVKRLKNKCTINNMFFRTSPTHWNL